MANSEVDALRRANAGLRTKIREMEAERAEAEAKQLQRMAIYDNELSTLRAMLGSLRGEQAKQMRDDLAKKDKTG